jgi:Protein of unknown function (DUF3987)
MSTRTAWLPVLLDTIPRRLQDIPRWVLWKSELRHNQWTKIPIRAHDHRTNASVTDPETWASFDDTVDSYSLGGFDGIGYVLAVDDPIAGVDLDKCRDPQTGVIEAWACRIVERLRSYTEISPSGRGLRIFAFGYLPDGGRKKGPVEMYDDGRFLTVTGHHLAGTPPSLEVRLDELHAVHAELFPPPPPPSAPRELALTDHDVLALAFGASNGAKVRALWRGDTTGYASPSEADAALAAHLAFWCGRDVTQMDRMFRASGLMRKKWDERRGTSTYGADTLAYAVAKTTKTYTGQRPDARPTTATSGGARRGADREPPAPAPVAWPTPRPPPVGLPPVPAFDGDRMLPRALAAWVNDIAERAQCPPDFVGIASVVGLASVVGRQMTIRPKVKDDWTVVPNLWGAAIGRPGVMKSPALKEAIRPLNRLAVEARKEYERKREGQRFVVAKAKAQRELLGKQLKEAVKGEQATGDLEAKYAELERAEAEPTERRYVVNDATVEKLGMLLNANPNGLLVHRDELTGWLRLMDREGHENDRAFYCEAWRGTGDYTYDRVGRGTIRIDAACVSVLGGIQPGPLAAYLHEVFGDGASDDGLIQRFQLMTYPDVAPEWRNVDRWPDTEAKNAAFEIFRALADLDVQAVGGHAGTSVPFLRFTPEAQDVFDAWRTSLERHLRGGADEHPVVISHLAKYRSLMPSLALLFHLINCVDRGTGGPVSVGAAEQALVWCEYLKKHARRVYQTVTAAHLVATEALGTKIKAGALPSPFLARMVQRKGWAGLTELQLVGTALGMLQDLHWLRRVPVLQEPRGGRPTSAYHITPALPRAAV